MAEETSGDQQVQDTPIEIPEKFQNDDGSANVQAILKSYNEAETKLSQPPADPPADTPPANTNSDSVPPDNALGIQANTDTPTDMMGQFQPFFEEFDQNRALSDDSFDKLAEQGYPREVVEAYMTSQQAAYDAQAESLINEAGGTDNWQKMLTWANTAMTPDEAAEFDQKVSRFNATQREEAVRGLISRYQKANGQPDTSISGQADAGVSSVMGYRSDAEMRSDMSDARYKSDAHFRHRVAQKTAVMMGMDPGKVPFSEV